jgi:hypothetical protein
MTKSNHPAPFASESRERLASMIAARDEATQAMTLAHDALARLQAAQSLAEPVEREIANIDAQETAAIAAWSRTTGEEPAPTPDATKRSELNRRLIDARARADAAKRAVPALEAEYAREAAKAPAIAAWADAATAAILIESTEPLIADFEAANIALSAKAVRLMQLQEVVGDMARRLPEGSEPARQIFVALEAYAGRLQKVLPRAQQDDDAASVSRMAWLDLAGRLHTDANAKLGA